MGFLLALALAAGPATAGPPELAGCRQGECVWRRVIATRTVRTLAGGRLRRQDYLEGRSLHPDSVPGAYSPKLGVTWSRPARTDYVFCSPARPSFAFRSGNAWTAHRLDLFALGGYDRASGALYLKLCHRLDLDRPGIERQLRRLGYRPGTPSGQYRIRSPLDLPGLPGTAIK